MKKNLFPTIKHLLSALLIVAGLASAAQAQEKKPTLMIVPSDNWCTMRYFTQTFDNQGTKVRVPDYQRAFQEDTELREVIAKVGQVMTQYGFSVKDCEQELKAIASRQAEDNVTMSKTSGAQLVESPLDVLKRRAKADIIVQVDWKVNKSAKGNVVTFTLEAFDSYSSKRVATSTGTGKPGNDVLPKMLEDAVKSNAKEFDRQLCNYFREILKNGREIVFTIRCFDSWGMDLEEEFGGEELIDCIQAWLHDNTVNGQFNLSDQTEDMAQFEQVRIPCLDEKGHGTDARSFATKLRKHLAAAPYGIVSKVMVRGLGEAVLVLGEK